MGRRYAEDALQAGIVQFIRAVAPGCIVAAIPNGAFHDARQGARLKWTGMLPGIPDLVVAFADGRVLWVEVKAPDGRLSREQKAIHHHLFEMGHAVLVARSIDDVRDELRRLGIETREAA